MDDIVKNRILTQLANTLKIVETRHGNEDFEVIVHLEDEQYEWNLTGWDKIK